MCCPLQWPSLHHDFDMVALVELLPPGKEEREGGREGRMGKGDGGARTWDFRTSIAFPNFC